MNRREALQRTAQLLGYAVGGSALAGVLQGCRAQPALDWSPAFFDPSQAAALSAMVDHLLPKTSTPGGLDVMADRFIDAIMKDYFSREEQQAFEQGLANFEADCRKTQGAGFASLQPAQKDEMFRRYEAQSAPMPPTIWGGQISETVPPLSFYRQFKQLALVGYYTSETVGKTILNYDPIPGRFDGCVPLASIGNAWSL
jgi:glucoside 3-dehydrogenase (cytochrome c) hitch-hiker subunit